MRETLENSNLQVNIHGIYKLISWNLQVNPVIFVRFWGLVGVNPLIQKSTYFQKSFTFYFIHFYTKIYFLDYFYN
jgi:hypothetical protein